MANQLKMAQQQAIQTLIDQGWSQRRIARELGVHRDTVARYFGQHRQGCVSDSSRSDDSPDSKPAIPITGSAAVEKTPARSKAGRQSLCDPLRETIISKLDAGLSAQRICQDLVSEQVFHRLLFFRRPRRSRVGFTEDIETAVPSLSSFA